MPVHVENDFEKIIPWVRSVAGAVCITEMFALYCAIRKHLKAEEAVAIDLGAHFGKSSCVALTALSDMERKDRFYMIDPLYDLKKYPQVDLGYNYGPNFLERAVENATMFSDLDASLVAATSEDFFNSCTDSLSYAFVDSGNHETFIMYEAEQLEKRIIEGGLIVFHDYMNQYTQPRYNPSTAYNYLISTEKFKEIDLEPDFALKIAALKGWEEGNITWQMNIECALGCVQRI